MKEVTISSKAIPASPRSKNYPVGSTVVRTGGGNTTITLPGGGSNIDVLKTTDAKSMTDSNVLSSLRALLEIRSRIIASTDNETALTEDNTLSSIHTIAEIDAAIKSALKDIEALYLSKTKADTAAEAITFLKGLFVGDNLAFIDANGDAEVRNIVARIKAKVATLEVTGDATTLNLLVQQLATTYDLDVSHVATMFRTIIKDYVSSETFVPGLMGEGMKIYKALNGDWNLEIDNVVVRKVMTIFELVISKIRAVNGGLVISSANGRIKSVEETTGDPTYYVLGIEGDMQFVADDLVRCQVFTAGHAKYYWVSVASVTADSILVLKSEFTNGATPVPGDDLIQMGNRTDKNRQGLLYLTASEDGKPRFSVMDGIDSTSLVGKSKVILGCLDGMTDTDFPADFQPSGYGLYAMNVFLKGVFLLRNGKNVEDEVNAAKDAAQDAKDKADTVTRLFQEFTVAGGLFESKITEVKEYADAAKNAAIDAAALDAQNKANAAQAAAELVAIAQAALAKTEASAYADGIVTAEEQRAINDAKAKLEEAKLDATTKADAAKNAAIEDAAGKYNTKSEVSSLISQTKDEINLSVTEKISNVQVGGRNYLYKSRIDNASLWQTNGGVVSVVQDDKFGSVVEYSRPEGGGDFQLVFDLNRPPLTNATIMFSIIAKEIGEGGFWYFGGWQESFTKLSPSSPKIDLGNGWFQYYASFDNTSELGSPFGLNSIAGTWRFYAASVMIGNKATDWTPAPEDIQTQITANASAIEVNKQGIELKASKTELNGLGDRVSSAEGSIGVQAGQIALMVKKDDLTATGIDITNRKIVLTSDKVVFQNNSGNQIAVFENDRIKADLIDASKIVTAELIAGIINATNITATNLTVTGNSKIGGFRIDDGSLSCEGSPSLIGFMYGGNSASLGAGGLIIHKQNTGIALAVTGGAGNVSMDVNTLELTSNNGVVVSPHYSNPNGAALEIRGRVLVRMGSIVKYGVTVDFDTYEVWSGGRQKITLRFVNGLLVDWWYR